MIALDSDTAVEEPAIGTVAPVDNGMLVETVVPEARPDDEADGVTTAVPETGVEA